MYKTCITLADEQQKSLNAESDEAKRFRELVQQGQMGYARTTLRTGDIPRGMKLVQSLKDPSLFAECASLLETMKQYLESALLYEKCFQYDKAAELYIRSTSALIRIDFVEMMLT
jgi:WD repeat-containing protein 19